MLKRAAAMLILLVLAACASQPRLPPALPPPPLQVAPPPPSPPGEPPGVVGLEDDQVRAAFGEPSFIRKDGAAQMWRYDSPGCKAFFFLYLATGYGLAVRHVETVPRGTYMAADPECLAALHNRRIAPGS